MLTHALFPERFLATLRDHLCAGGMALFYLENSDARMHQYRKNLIGEMKCFHFQNFDVPTLVRCLSRHGFEAESIKVSKSALSMIARREDSVQFEPIGERELLARLRMYERWRDESVLSLPPEAQERFEDGLAEIRERAVRGGLAVLNGDRVEPARELALANAQGYVALNERRGDAKASDGT
jgi:hypothetical protein